jgi:hypothetical protein
VVVEQFCVSNLALHLLTSALVFLLAVFFFVWLALCLVVWIAAAEHETTAGKNGGANKETFNLIFWFS